MFLHVIGARGNTLLGHNLFNGASSCLRDKEPGVEEAKGGDGGKEDKGGVTESLVERGEDKANDKVGTPVDTSGDGRGRGKGVGGQQLGEQQPWDGTETNGEGGGVQEDGDNDQDTNIGVGTNDQED